MDTRRYWVRDYHYIVYYFGEKARETFSKALEKGDYMDIPRLMCFKSYLFFHVHYYLDTKLLAVIIETE